MLSKLLKNACEKKGIIRNAAVSLFGVCSWWWTVCHYQLVGTPEAAFSRKPSSLTLPFLPSQMTTSCCSTGTGGLDLGLSKCLWVERREEETKGEG